MRVATTSFKVALVVTVNVTEASPAGTRTLAGTWAAGSLLDRATLRPPRGAGPDKVNVAADEPPPLTLAGLRARVVGVMMAGGGSTTREASLLPPP